MLPHDGGPPTARQVPGGTDDGPGPSPAADCRGPGDDDAQHPALPCPLPGWGPGRGEDSVGSRQVAPHSRGVGAHESGLDTNGLPGLRRQACQLDAPGPGRLPSAADRDSRAGDGHGRLLPSPRSAPLSAHLQLPAGRPGAPAAGPAGIERKNSRQHEATLPS